jgi:hypothetical protein
MRTPLGLRAASTTAGKRFQYIANYAIASSQTTFTFNDVSFGTPAFNRTIIIVLLARSSTARSFSSCTIAGNTPNIVGSTGTTNVPRNIFSINLPSGTSGTVSATFSGAVSSGCSIAVYAVYGLSSDVAVSSGNDGVSGATSRSVTLTTNSSDFIFAGLLLGDNQTPTWSNVTQNSQVGIGDSRQTYYASNSASPSGSVTVTATWPVSITNGLVAANFR